MIPAERRTLNPGHPARRGFQAAMCALQVLSAVSACGDGPGTVGMDIRPSGAIQRTVRSPQWIPAFQVGGAAADTTLLMPSRPAVDADGIYVLDIYGARVVRYDLQGRLLWSYGRKGSGPGEFREPRDLQVDRLGRAWVLDPSNARITIVNRQGRAEAFVPLDQVGYSADDLIPLSPREALLIVSEPNAPLVRLALTGKVLERRPFPWPGFARLNPLASQLITRSDPSSGWWSAAFQLGDGFFVFSGPDWQGYRGWFADPVPFPTVREERAGSTVTARVQNPTFAALSLAMSATRLYVLFSGTNRNTPRVLDSYSLADGSYLESFRLPRPVHAIALGAGVLYGLYEDPFPVLAAWRPQGARLP